MKWSTLCPFGPIASWHPERGSTRTGEDDGLGYRVATHLHSRGPEPVAQVIRIGTRRRSIADNGRGRNHTVARACGGDLAGGRLISLDLAVVRLAPGSPLSLPSAKDRPATDYPIRRRDLANLRGDKPTPHTSRR